MEEDKKSNDEKTVNNPCNNKEYEKWCNLTVGKLIDRDKCEKCIWKNEDTPIR